MATSCIRLSLLRVGLLQLGELPLRFRSGDRAAGGPR